jgi:hypothetical protein
MSFDSFFVFFFQFIISIYMMVVSMICMLQDYVFYMCALSVIKNIYVFVISYIFYLLQLYLQEKNSFVFYFQ